MLDTVSKEQLVSYLTSDLAVSSITAAESGLSVQLLSNCVYYVEMAINASCLGDGMQYRLQYSGSLGIVGMVYTDVALATTSQFILNTTYASPGASSTFVVYGVVPTGRGGRLYLEIRKDTNAGGPSILAAGSHLVARRL